MSPKLCGEVERSLWRYIDRELSARDVARISAHLKDCRSCNRLFEARSRENSLYRLAYVESPFGDDFAERFREAFADCTEEPEDAASDIFSFDPPVRHRRLAVAASVAAILVIAVIGLLLRRGASPDPDAGPLAGSAPASGDASGVGAELVARSSPLPESPDPGPSVASEGAESNGRESMRLGVFLEGTETLVDLVDGGAVQRLSGNEIQPGVAYQLRPPSPGNVTESSGARPVELALMDGSRLAFTESPWRFEISSRSSPTDGTFEAFLGLGELNVSVVRRSPDVPFAIQTPNALFRVVGTRFHLRVTAVGGRSFTALEVHEGEVEVEDLETRQVHSVRPSSGESVYPAAAFRPERTRPSASSSPNLDRPFQIRDGSRG